VVPLVEVVKGAAAELAEEPPASPTTVDVFAVAVDKVIIAVATTPFDIAAELRPQTKHVKVPVF
jgi:hypothetical protein